MNDPIRCSEFSCPYCQSRDLTYLLMPSSSRIFRTEIGPLKEVKEFWGPVRDYTCHNCEYEWSAQDDQTTEGHEPHGDIAVPDEEAT